MTKRHQTPFAFYLPEGFRYRPDLIDEMEEAELLRHISGLEFQPFEFQGYLAKRRVVGFGLIYDFTAQRETTAPPVPDFLRPIREKVARFAGFDAQELVQASITEYPVGAPIGWHRDRPQFDSVFGVSLLSSCQMRLRPYGEAGQVVSLELEPRSAYVITGPARSNYEHSIPAVETLRYSITFRTVRKGYQALVGRD